MFTFTKKERICSKLIIDKLFEGGNQSMAVYPLRAVYMPVEKGEVPVSILVSVPKRRFHHAVDRNRLGLTCSKTVGKAVERNRAKRVIREAYRLNKHILWNKLGDAPKSLAIAFICIADKPCSTANVMNSMKKILHRIEERTEI